MGEIKRMVTTIPPDQINRVGVDITINPRDHPIWVGMDLITTPLGYINREGGIQLSIP